MPDKHFDPSQKLTGKRYLQICFDRTYGRILRAFLQLKTYKKTYARPYFWLEVTGLGQSRYRDTSACVRRPSRAYNGRTVSRHLNETGRKLIIDCDTLKEKLLQPGYNRIAANFARQLGCFRFALC